jgi:hypothetical protein
MTLNTAFSNVMNSLMNVRRGGLRTLTCYLVLDRPIRPHAFQYEDVDMRGEVKVIEATVTDHKNAEWPTHVYPIGKLEDLTWHCSQSTERSMRKRHVFIT